MPLDPSDGESCRLLADTATKRRTSSQASCGEVRRLEAPEVAEGCELVQGLLQLTKLPELMEQLPEAAPFALHGLRFWTALTPAHTDQLLATLPSLGGSGVIMGGPADRRGLSSPVDPVVARLEDELAQALDPGRTLR